MVKEYYNLIKHTFNVLDVIDNVPHFKGMIDSLVLTHNMLLNASEKYKFVYGKGKDTIHAGNELDSNFNKRYIDKYTVGKLASMFDMIVAEKWLGERVNHINFNLKNLMRAAGVDTYQIYTNDGMKSESTANGPEPSIREIALDDNSNPVISLNTTHGITMFKRVMEDLILPILQRKGNSEFLDSLKLENVKNPFGLSGDAIVSIHSLQELNSASSLAQFEQLLNDFDSLDTKDDLKGILKNNVGSAMKVRDIFFLYNLIVHQEKYGNKRLTPILESYMKETNSLGYDYVRYYSEVDRGNIDLFESLKNKHGSNWETVLRNNIFFHINNNRGRVRIKGDINNSISITNPHVTMMTDIGYTPDIDRTFTDINDLARLIREKGWAITLEC